MSYQDVFRKEYYSENVNKISVDAIYYINLNRAPERKSHFLQQCTDASISHDLIHRQEAIDGKTHVFSEEQHDLFRFADFRHEPFASRIMGNQLSHLAIMHDVITNGYTHVLVFQDDVILRKGITSYINRLLTELPDDAEMVNIGYHAHAWFDSFSPWDLTSESDTDASFLCREKVNDSICRLYEDKNPNSLAYLLTQKGAQRMSKYFTTNGFRHATDVTFNLYLRERNIFYFTTNVLATGNHEFESSIFR
jgi:GR25 family glycosyltransferase involved in LPS biosynthesis